MIRFIRSLKTAALSGAAFVAVAVCAGPAQAAPVYLAPPAGSIPGGEGISIKLSVVNVGGGWAVGIRNMSTTDSLVTGWSFEQGLGQSGPFVNTGSITPGGTYRSRFRFVSNPDSPGGNWSGSAFGFEATNGGIAEGDPGNFFFTISRPGGYTEQDILELFNNGGFRVAVNIVIPQIGSYVLTTGPQLTNEPPPEPQNPGTGVVVPTPAAFGAGLAMFGLLTMKRRRTA